MSRHAPAIVTLVAALAGLGFASVSTYDFAQHLDRQVHGLHCSFLPGVEAADSTGETGCHVTLMSPYSSVLRESVWGGIPISLPAIALFAFLLAASVWIVAMRRQTDRFASALLCIAWSIPLLTSIAMGYISIATLDAACKVCIGIYASSAVGFIAAAVGWYRSEPVHTADYRLALSAALLAALFVSTPVAAYAAASPSFESYVGTCGELPSPADPHGVLVPIGPQTHAVPVLEVLDPMCPACRGFEERFQASSTPEQASRKVLLFPLDDTCNWMVDHTIHPGACAVSEAVLCAGDEAEAVLEWAFEQQEEITRAARHDPSAAVRLARQRFPMLADCIGSPRAQARLNQALRWAVGNQLPVLTPQVYVGHLRLCDADTDLGMDYALPRLVERYRTSPPRIEPEPAAPLPAPPTKRPATPSAARQGLTESSTAPSLPGSAPSAPSAAPSPPIAAPSEPSTATATDVPSNPASLLPTTPAASPGSTPVPIPVPTPSNPPSPAPAPSAPHAPTPAPAPSEPAPSEPAQ